MELRRIGWKTARGESQRNYSVRAPVCLPREKDSSSGQTPPRRPLRKGVEDPHLRPVDRLLGDKFLVPRGDLVLVVRFLAVEDDDQGHVEFLVVHRPLVGRLADAGAVVDGSRMIGEVLIASGDERLARSGGLVLQG